jgi:hypothetical protein
MIRRGGAQVWVQAEDLAVAQAEELLVLIGHHARLPGQPHALPRARQAGQHGLALAARVAARRRVRPQRGALRRLLRPQRERVARRGRRGWWRDRQARRQTRRLRLRQRLRGRRGLRRAA